MAKMLTTAQLKRHGARLHATFETTTLHGAGSCLHDVSQVKWGEGVCSHEESANGSTTVSGSTGPAGERLRYKRAHAHAPAMHSMAPDQPTDARSLNHHQTASLTGTGGCLLAALPTKPVTGTGVSLCTKYGIVSDNGASS